MAKGASVFAVMYRWRIRLGREEEFREGWRRVTRAIHEQCGSYGSRLHRATDGTFVAYARWPSPEARDACEHGDAAGSRMMREAVEEDYPELTMLLLDDLLAEQ